MENHVEVLGPELLDKRSRGRKGEGAWKREGRGQPKNEN